jgi:membrane protease YdiL (CAAX protease family)
MERPNGWETLKLAGITAVWLAFGNGLVWIGERVIPDAWKARISLPTFMMACQITTALVGLALSFGLLARPRAALALTRPRLRQLAVTALLAPAFLVSTTVIALQVALPTLIEEMKVRGAGATRQSAGEFGRMLEQGPLLLTLLWAAILAATTEELLFRGALWSLVERFIQTFRAILADHRSRSRLERPDPEPRTPSTQALEVLLGLVPTVVSAGIFGLMHGDLRGGVGIVRVVSSTLLGFGAGLLRRWTGTLFASVLLHFLNNTMVIGHGRKWFSGGPPAPPLIDGVPDRFVGIAVAGLIGSVLLWVWLGSRDRRLERDRVIALGARDA